MALWSVCNLHLIQANTLGEAPWQFASQDAQAIFDRVKAAHTQRLNGVSEIFVGVQTSADNIYIFQATAEQAGTVTLHWNGHDWPIERGILRPALLDVQVPTYSRPAANTWMIFPYEFDQTTGAACLIQPADMTARYPNCFAYLQSRRTELENRQITGGKASDKQFYQFGRSQSLTKFNSPKIVFSTLSRGAQYAYDDTNTMVTGGGNGPYYMVRPRSSGALSNYYLLAVLNHPLSEAMVRSNTSPFRGGYYSHGKQFIENLPVPLPSQAQLTTIENLVEQLIQALQAAAASRLPQQKLTRERQAAVLRSQIEAAVSELFGLSPADMVIVEAVPVPA